MSNEQFEKFRKHVFDLQELCDLTKGNVEAHDSACVELLELYYEIERDILTK